jgi:hypothetical protein
MSEGAPDQSAGRDPVPDVEPSAERAVGRVKSMYDLVGPKLGARFVESNVVLTLADARGTTFLVLDEDEFRAGAAEDVDRINRTLKEEGIRLRLGPLKSNPRDISMSPLYIESLKGYEVASRRTKIPGFMRFNASTGWAGLNIWRQEVSRRLENAQYEGKIPKEYDIDFLFDGVIRGYPDRAIYDACDSGYDDEKRSKEVEAKLPFVSLYASAQPNYDFYREHINDAGIVVHQKEWGDILEDFYSSEWHSRVRTSPEFVSARRHRDDTPDGLWNRFEFEQERP